MVFFVYAVLSHMHLLQTLINISESRKIDWNLLQEDHFNLPWV